MAYILGSFKDLNSSAILPSGLLIWRIIVDSPVDLSFFTPSLINATYNFHTFSSTGYVKVGEKLVKKDSVKARADSP